MTHLTIADMNITDSKHYTPLMPLKKSEVEAECLKNSQTKRILANVNGIRGTYCGLSRSEGTSFAKKMLDTLPREVTRLIPFKAVSAIRVGFIEHLKCTPPNEIVDAIQNNQLLLLPLGYETHYVSLGFYSGYMVICNRGGGRKKGRKTFDVFRIDPKKFTLEILEALIYIRRYSSRKGFTDFYYDKLPNFLSPLSSSDPLKDEICLWVEELSPGPQKVRNCVWANVKDGLLAMDALMRFIEKIKLADEIKPEEVATIQKEAKIFAKGFSDHARLSSIDQFFQAEIRDDRDLLEEAVCKVIKRKLTIPFSRYRFLMNLFNNHPIL